jgi:prolyl-tRNA synthetase
MMWAANSLPGKSRFQSHSTIFKYACRCAGRMAKEQAQGIAKKSTDFSEWYVQAITRAELVDYTSVSGCFAFRPYGYAIWERLVAIVDAKLKAMGVQNCYFPLFIPERLLKKEQQHVKGFAPEVAWVETAGNTKLDERLAIRPTSETIMYESYSKWIRSWRDLPLRLNQWNNVVRWEFKHPTPLIRTREFLWNEGHSAFATRKEAEAEIEDILSLWKDVTENVLALAGLLGKKSEAEKFAGAIASYSIEFVLPNGKAAQGPDAHFDGQNFAKAFDITFLNAQRKKEFVWQNTWAISTRMIGILAMIHGDDRGLVLPPEIAPIQVVIVPILFEDSKKSVLAAAKKLEQQLKKTVRVHLDDRDSHTPGWKFNEWELKGVPVRIELGPKDLAKNQVVIARRDTGKKDVVPLATAVATVADILRKIQQDMLAASRATLERSITAAKDVTGITKALKSSALASAAFCGSEVCEAKLTGSTEAKSLCISREGTGTCVFCGKDGKPAYFGRSY